MSASSLSDATGHYRAFCELDATITGDQVEAKERLELLDGSIGLSRIRALYPLDLDRIYKALVEKLSDRNVLERFMHDAMNAYNPLVFDALLHVSYDEADEWSQNLSNAIAGGLDDFSENFFEQATPEGWVYTNPPIFHAYDLALSLYTALNVSENWEAWAIDFEIEREEFLEGEQSETWVSVHRPTLEDAAGVLGRYIRAMKPVLAALS